MTTAIIIAVIVLIGVVAAGAIILARSSKRTYDKQSELFAGQSSTVPSQFGGSHDPEARLFRRLRDAIAALHANAIFTGDALMLDARVQIDLCAQQITDDLIAISKLPQPQKTLAVAPIEPKVAGLESLAADLVTLTGTKALDRAESTLALLAPLPETPAVEPLQSSVTSSETVQAELGPSTPAQSTPRGPTPAQSTPAHSEPNQPEPKQSDPDLEDPTNTP